MTIVLTGQMCSGKNRIMVRRDGLHYPQKRFVKWRDDMARQIQKQIPCNLHPIQTPVSLRCLYWPGDEITRDVSGMLDALFYLLVYTAILRDDGLIYNVRFERQSLNRKFPKLIMDVEYWT